MADDQTRQVQALAEAFLQDYCAFYPINASIQGLHEYDGRINDLRIETIHAWIDSLHSYRGRLNTIQPATLDRLAWFDYALLCWRVDAELWNWAEYREYERNPMLYTENATVDYYVQRNYAPLEERAQALTRHLRQIPQAMEVARQNLGDRVAPILIEESVPVFEGLITFLNESLAETFQPDTLSPPTEAALWAARDEAAHAIDDLVIYLRDTLYPRVHNTFAIGAEQFSRMLAYNEQITIPLDQLLAAGEADLLRNKQALEEVAARIDASKTVREHMAALGRNHPPADRLLEEVRTMLEDLRTFVIERDLVTVPNEVHCLVEETPPFARWAFAMMDTTGPFEEVATESFYYITLPEPDWPPEKVEGWLTKFDYAKMTGVSIHEAYPGHYIHFMHVRHAPTRLARAFETYSHFESWAHYSEEMMLDQGYGNGDLRLRMAQLSEALVRNCRYLCAIKMHTQGMSIDEATRFFIDHAYMDEVPARKEARRGTHDPGYINYSLGKFLLRKLLNDYKEAYGESFSLKQFHDAYIGHGSPPIPMLRTLMLPSDDGVLL
jgi:uncharacterized protein (DUF885 family)